MTLPTAGSSEHVESPRRSLRLDEIASLTAQNRSDRDGAVDERLVRLRHDAFWDLPKEPLAVWPRVFDDPFPGVSGRPPEIDSADLTAAVASGAIRHHGCLLVRGLFSAERAARLVDDIDSVFHSRDEALAGAPSSRTQPWYKPFDPGPDSPSLTESQRRWVRECGAVWVADSPAAMFDVVEAFDEVRIPQIVSDCLGETAVLSVNKWTLRRVSPDANGAWHQDGSFLGPGVRTVAVWVALTGCGDETNAPGLTIVPRRVDFILPTNGALSPIAISQEDVSEALNGCSFLHPTFGVGDALLFDELFVHRTGGTKGTTRHRYALESWFFTPSTFPSPYVALAI